MPFLAGFAVKAELRNNASGDTSAMILSVLPWTDDLKGYT